MRLEGRPRVTGNEGEAAMTARPTGADGVVIEALDTTSFGDHVLVTSMRAYWSPDRSAGSRTIRCG